MKTTHFSLILAAVTTIALYSCGGDAGKTADSSATLPKPTGEEIYGRACAACHQSNGEGLQNVYPPLVKSDFLNDKEKTIAQIINGSSGEMTVNGVKYNNAMPAQPLSDDDVATVLTYIYTNFGNSGGAVTVEDVKAVRAKAK